MMQTIYQIWLARNDARDGKRMGEPRMIAEKVNFYLQEWQEVNSSARVPKVCPL